MLFIPIDELIFFQRGRGQPPEDQLAAAPRISLSKIKNILAFASDDHAKAFLAFHGLQIVIDKDFP